MENLSNMCICLHGSGARRVPYTHYSHEPLPKNYSNCSLAFRKKFFLIEAILLMTGTFNLLQTMISVLQRWHRCLERTAGACNKNPNNLFLVKHKIIN